MKNIKHIFNSVGLVACLGFTVTSCDLDVLPLNEVVLENYWTNKEDVNSVLTSCYAGMLDEAWVNKAMVWGEVRSDNITLGPDVPGDLRNLILGNLKQTNSACDWSPFYTVINRCNNVIHYAPSVQKKDPNLDPSQLEAILAEAKGIRALNYFYLVRAFNNVPFTLDASISDLQDYQIPATEGTVILDSLINEIEPLVDKVPRSYFIPAKNSARFTRAGMYTLLADMYLWRASDATLPITKQQEYYLKCIQYCDKVIEYKNEVYNKDVDGDLNSLMDKTVLEKCGYPLLAEKPQGASAESAPRATNAIFSTGNSFEAILELTYGTVPNDPNKPQYYREGGADDPHNMAVAKMYGGSDDKGKSITWTMFNSSLMPNALKSGSYSDQSLFSVTSDYRSLTSFRYAESGEFQILKYVNGAFSGRDTDFGSLSATTWKPGTQRFTPFSYSSTFYNWIIYRLSEVMLMRAEAEICYAGNITKIAEMEAEQEPEPEPGDPDSEEEQQPDPVGAKTRASIVLGSSLSTPEELYADAFNLILAVNMRSNPIASTTTTTLPKAENYKTYDALITLLENERHREFLFEGKRYFDLVRRARREGSTVHFSQAISPKFGQASKSVLIKMAMMEFMYMPYIKSQLDANPKLKQNPAYAEDEDIKKN